MPLPLPIRKGIRDSEPKLKEHIEKINNVTGKEWTLEVDWEACVGKIEPSSKERIGSLYQDEVMENLANNLERSCKDPLTKESLLETCTNGRIIIRVNEKCPSYWAYKFENGDLILEHKPSICNTSDITYADLATTLPAQSGALPLKVRQNIESMRERQQELLENIAKITGSGEWILEVDWNDCVAKIEPSSQNRIGDIYIDEILDNVRRLLEDKLKKETLKEAFNEATSARTITILCNDKIPSYWDLSFKDNGLLIQHKKSICNTSDVAYYDIARVMPVPGIISMVSKLNLEEKREDFEAAMEEIKKATGEEFTFDESSVEGFYTKLEPSEKNRVGDIIYAELLTNLAANLKKKLADEMVKEAFMEMASARQIALAFNPKQSGYWDIKFENGVLIVSAKSICNMSDITYFDIEKLL